MESDTENRTNVLDYVSCFREKLNGACDLARNFLKDAQSEMKDRYDKQLHNLFSLVTRCWYYYLIQVRH